LNDSLLAGLKNYGYIYHFEMLLNSFEPEPLTLMLLRCLLFTLFTGACQADTIRIRSDEWYPMNGDPNSKHPGYMIDLAKVILEPVGHKVDYKVMPWKRALAETRAGNSNCVVGAIKNEAPDFLYPKIHWGVDQAAIYVIKNEGEKDHWRYDGKLSSLIKRKTGVILGYFYGDELDVYFKQNSGGAFEFVSADRPLRQNIRKLLSGRINGVIETIPVMDAQLKQLGLAKKIIFSSSVGKRSLLYIACGSGNKNNQKYIDLIDRAMPGLRKSGKLQQILMPYGLSLW